MSATATVCPKCNHQRRPEDDAPDWQCPNCGVAYAKVGAAAETAIPGPTPAVPAQPKPTRPRGYVEQTLAANERILDRFSLHWSVWIPVFAAAVIGAAVLFAVPLGPALTLLAWGAALYQALQLLSLERALTTRRVISKRGIVSRHTEEMRLGSIETVEVRQGLWDRLLGSGTVRVTGRGVSAVTLNALDDPLAAKRDIETACDSSA